MIYFYGYDASGAPLLAAFDCTYFARLVVDRGVFAHDFLVCLMGFMACLDFLALTLMRSCPSNPITRVFDKSGVLK